MKMRDLVFILLSPSVALAAGASGMSQGSQFGVVAQTIAHQPCVVLQAPVQVGQLITIAKLRPAEFVAATVTKPAAACGLGLEPGYSYELAIPADQNDWWASTAVIGKVSPGLDFRECYGPESVHLSVWQGAQRIWKGYYYVDYEMEPSCIAEDLAD